MRMQYHRVRLGLLIILAVSTCFIWYVLLSEKHVLTVAFLDIGQGDSIYIESPTGNRVMIDAGPNKTVLRELANVMPFYDRTIDLAIATHPDKDHIGGYPDIFDRYQVSAFMEPGLLHDTKTYATLEQKVEDEGSKRLYANRHMVLALGGGAYLYILFPDRNTTGFESNAASIVAKLVYGDESFLLTGDSPIAIENYLVSEFGDKLTSTVLKPGHHGSRTSTGPAFLAAVQPVYAVISAGANNRYGHPHQEVMDALSAEGADILETKNGTVIFTTDGKTLTKK